MKWRSLRAWVEDIGGNENDYLRARRAFRASGRVSYPPWHPRRGEEVAVWQEHPREMIRVAEHPSQGAPQGRDHGESTPACPDPVEAARVVVARADPAELARLVVQHLDAGELARVLEQRGYSVRSPPPDGDDA